MERRDFFVSYTNSDEAWALWIANTLLSCGYTVYFQALDILPGDSFLTKMNDFLENSSNFIAVWSEGYSNSWYCMREMEAAFKACHEGRMSCLLPVKIDNYPMKLLYSALVHVNLSDMSAASEETLIDAVRRALLRSAPEPEPPKAPSRNPQKPVGDNSQKVRLCKIGFVVVVATFFVMIIAIQIIIQIISMYITVPQNQPWQSLRVNSAIAMLPVVNLIFFIAEIFFIIFILAVAMIFFFSDS